MEVSVNKAARSRVTIVLIVIAAVPVVGPDDSWRTHTVSGISCKIIMGRGSGHATEFSTCQSCSRWYLCARKSPYAFHPVSQNVHQRCLPIICLTDDETVPVARLIDYGPLSSFQGRSFSASSFHASFLQVIDGMMCLALCPQVVSQAPQHFRSSEKQATCEGCFTRQSICSVVSLHSGMSRAVHPQEFSKVHVDHTLRTSLKEGCRKPVLGVCVDHRHIPAHTPSIAFRHLPPNSARTDYATESPRSCPSTLSAPSERIGY